MPVNWKGIEELGEGRVLVALELAMNGKDVREIAKETGIPASSLYDIKRRGPFGHRLRDNDETPAKV